MLIISSDLGVRIDEWSLSSDQLGLPREVAWSVRKSVLHGGKQEGVDLVVVDNGRLKIWVIPTRGMSILKVEAGGVGLGWNSPVKEVVHPSLVNLQSRGGLGWLEGFNEWLVRCGLEFAGHPGRDSFVNNLGEPAEMDLTLHGKVGNTPASEVEFVADLQPPYAVHLRGRVDERMFYGPKLELWTKLTIVPGRTGFTIEDALTNQGAYEQEFQLIYHANFGPPLLGLGSRFVGAVKRVTPFNARAAQGLTGYEQYDAPTPGFVEQVYCIEPYADPEGKTTVLIHNQDYDVGVSTRFDVAQLPYFTLWKNLTALEEGYVTGLEPGTSFPYNRSVEREFGRVPTLQPGQVRQFRLEYEIHTGADAVGSVAKRIRQLQGDRPTRVESEPILPQ